MLLNYCPNCGRKLNGEYTLCPKCGKRLRYSGSPFGFSSELVKCAHCNGSGWINTGKLFSDWHKTCPVCGGKGVVRV